MTPIKYNLENIKKNIPSNVKLVAVSKTKPEADIIEAYNCGQIIFGENRIQELQQKKQNINLPIQWHMIGNLQSNKIKYISEFITLIQSVSSFKLLTDINNEAKKINRIIPCLLQIHIAKEETKSGFLESELLNLLEKNNLQEFKNIRIDGLMGIATFTNDTRQVEKEFKSLNALFNKLKSEYLNNTNFTELSMGMSNDYMIAIEQGSTMVRIGSSIFGDRVYS